MAWSTDGECHGSGVQVGLGLGGMGISISKLSLMLRRPRYSHSTAHSVSFPSNPFKETVSKMVAVMRSPISLAVLALSSIFSVNAVSNTTQFTPQAMLSAPRRSSALPNSDGTLALYTSTTWDFATHKRNYALSVLDLSKSNGSSTLLSNSSAVSNAQWLGNGTTILWLVSEDDGTTSFAIGDATKPDAE